MKKILLVLIMLSALFLDSFSQDVIRKEDGTLVIKEKPFEVPDKFSLGEGVSLEEAQLLSDSKKRSIEVEDSTESSFVIEKWYFVEGKTFDKYKIYWDGKVVKKEHLSSELRGKRNKFISFSMFAMLFASVVLTFFPIKILKLEDHVIRERLQYLKEVGIWLFSALIVSILFSWICSLKAFILLFNIMVLSALLVYSIIVSIREDMPFITFYILAGLVGLLVALAVTDADMPLVESFFYVAFVEMLVIPVASYFQDEMTNW